MAYDPTAPQRNTDGASHPRGILDRLPPFNLEVEQCLIGAVLLHNPALHEVAAVVRPADFYDARHAEIYAAILALYDAGRPVDVLLLADAMGPRYDALGGDDLLGEIMTVTPSAANAAWYAGVVREKATKRRVIEAAEETLRAAYADDTLASDLVALAEGKVFAIAEATATGDTLEVSEVVGLACDRIGMREAGEVSGIRTGFIDLDDMTDGMQAGNLIIVAARPSQGKTAWALNVADYVTTAAGGSALFVSLEMNRVEVGERMLSSRAKVDSYRFKNPEHLRREDRAAVGVAVDVLRRARLSIDDTPMRTVTQIAANARRIKARRGLDLLVVDYIQLIDGQRLKGENRQEEVARISKRLKAVARELQVPVVALAQLNRNSESRESRRPQLSDLRESGQIEADADIVILIHRPEYYDPDDRPGMADLIVAKNRNGATGTVQVVFERNITRFSTLAPHAGEAPEYADEGF